LRQTPGKQNLFWHLAKGGFQFMPAARKRFRSQILAIAIRAVENCEAPRKVPPLEELEARNSFRIERYNLAVEKQRSISKLTYCRGDVRKCGGPVEVVSRQ
jgi:hypothetical protein